MKKRILSLILALSMVLSVLPLGAFAADPPRTRHGRERSAGLFGGHRGPQLGVHERHTVSAVWKV